MPVISISLPDPLLHGADQVITKRGFSGRSEFVRACVRDFLVAQAPRESDDPANATLTLVYPDGREREFSKIRHAFTDILRTVIHGHAGAGCLEVFVLEGPAGRIAAFADALRATRSALQVAVTYATAAPGPRASHPHARAPARR